MFGAAAFGVGWMLFYLSVFAVIDLDVPRWQAATWVYLSAHYVTVSGMQVIGFGGFGRSFDLVKQTDLEILRAIPALLIVLASVLVSDVIGYTTHWPHLIRNASSVLLGYLSLLVVGFLQSAAQPGVAILLTTVVVAFVVLYLGSMFIRKAVGDLPILALVSIGTIAIIGLFLLVAGVSAIMALWPAVAFGIVSTLMGSVLVYISRTVPT